MNQLFNHVPQWLVVSICLAIGIFAIFQFNPPSSICDPQITQFRKTFRGELFPQPVKDNVIPGSFVKNRDDCRYGNSSGSCYQYFEILKKVSSFVHRSPSECSGKITEELGDIKRIYVYGFRLMTTFAWGAGPGTNPGEKVGWLKEYELSVFCDMRRAYTKLYGEEEWWQLRAGLLAELPNVENGKDIRFTSIEQKAERSLLTINCNYL